MKATWNDQVIAESDKTIFIEGNHYFPPDSIKKNFLTESKLTTTCPWKGVANYYNITDGTTKTDNDAAWYYKLPKEGSESRVGHTFKDYVAFYPQYVNVESQ